MRFLTLLVVLSLLSLVPLNAASRHADGDYVVVFNGSDSPDLVMRQHGVGQRPKKDKKWTSAVHGFSARLTGAQADRLESDTRVFVIEPDITVTNCAQIIPPGIQRIGTLANSYAAINGTDTRVNVDIAIIDTGIDLTHPDLYVYRSTNFVSTVTTANDDHGHGTHCAGIAAALDNTIGVVGVAPGARLWAVKVLDSTGNGTLSQVISGVDYVTQNAASIEVASMSLAGQGQSESLRLAIQNCVAKGVVVVVAAGNSGIEIFGGDWLFGTTDDFFPASYPEVMTVSAMADTDGIAGGLGASTAYGLDDTLGSFSNYSRSTAPNNPVSSPGSGIDLAAPGVNIYSTINGGGYGYKSGTSMACPHVSGAVGLYAAQHGRATTASGVYAIRQAMINYGLPAYTWGRNQVNNSNNDNSPEPLVWVGAATVGSYPNLVVYSPAQSSEATQGATISVSAGATDVEDGDLSASIVWKLNSVAFATNSSSTVTLSTLGANVITAQVTDSDSNISTISVSVTVKSASASSPIVTITSPIAGSTNASPLTFTGTAIDAEDGNISSLIKWYFNGNLFGTGASTSASFPNGQFTMVATAQDSSAQKGTNSVTFFIGSVTPPPPPLTTNYPPSISISYPANGAAFASGTSITASGSATDTEDGTLSSSITWVDSLDGALTAGATTTYTPSIGTHNLVASVTDSGSLSANASRSFTVSAPVTPLSVTLAANKAAYKNKEKAILTATVTVSGSGVSGATCNFTVRGSSGKTVYKTVTTTTAGTAQFQLSINKAQLGAGTATVTVNASKTGYTAAQGSTTFTIL